MQWIDVKEGHTFVDGSVTTQVHDIHDEPCYTFIINKKPLTISETHVLLAHVGLLTKSFLRGVAHLIPRESDVHFYKDDKGNISERTDIVAWDDFHVKNNNFWLEARTIYWLLTLGKNVSLVNSKGERVAIQGFSYVGIKPCFCVSTDTGHYEVCDVVHHNSVAIRNIIFHSLTHSNDIKLGMVDLKLSEFSRYKGMNNVVGVANSVREAAELLRLCREVMYKRNKLNAERDITDCMDYKPQKPTDKIMLFGVQFDENQQFDVEISGEKKTMTAKEILDWVDINY